MSEGNAKLESKAGEHTDKAERQRILESLLVEPVHKTERQITFESKRKGWSEKDILLEMLFRQTILIEKTDKVRGNTNTLIWWLIVLPILLGVIIALATMKM